MQSDDTSVRVPLRARDGSVRAHALIDAADAEHVNRWLWYMTPRGYAVRGERVKGQTVTRLLHRQLLGLVRGDGLDGDHINRNKLDNRRCNLRVIPRGRQPQNGSSYPGTSSRYRGVNWNKRDGLWYARVQANGKDHYLGSFTDEAEAAEAARVARLRLLPYAVD